MVSLTTYSTVINENFEENLYFKLDKWFDKKDDQKKQFINIITTCKSGMPNKDVINYMLNNIKFDIENFVDFLIDNTDKKQTIEDYLYIMQKIIETIIANKTNNYNIEEQ